MPGTAIGKQLNNGYVGKVTSSRPNTLITNRTVRSTDTNPVPFGSAVVTNSDNTCSVWAGTNTAAQFAGVAVAEVKQATSYLNAPNGVSQYNAGDRCDVLRTGTIIVTCTEGTPTAGGAVYLVTTAATSGGVSGTVVGSFIANSAPAGTGGVAVKLTNVVWKTGNIDANNSSEIEILYPINA